MCGVAGWCAPPDSDPVALDAAMRRMTATLAHRGPDDQGQWTDARGGIALGFRRLSILDLTATGRQPMPSGDGRYVSVFNGEVYNHRDLRAELQRGGIRFRGRSDTEVVVETVAAFGVPAALDKLWGMFALAVWDRVEHSLYLARDRLGKKPLYVARIGRAGWLFASELKALCAVEAFGRDLDPAAVAAYLRFGFVPTPLTIFRGAWKLAPGTFSRFRFGQPVRSGTYWSIRRVAHRGKRRLRTRPAEHLVSELDELLRDAVSRRMIADVPVGVFLSGGIDSATVTALMQAQSARPVETFSIGFHERRYDEAVAAAALARHLGTEHRQQYVSAEEARTVLPHLAEVYDEPFADATQIPTLLVSHLARKSVTVALSGDGGDEVFAGYKHYSAIRTLSSVFSAVPRPLRKPAGALLTGVPGGWWDAALALAEPILPAWGRNQRHGEKIHKVGALLSRGCLQDDLYWGSISLWPDPDELAPGTGTGCVPSESARLDPEIPEIGERMLVYDQACYLPDDILVMVDRASMAASLEVRSPLLDHRIVEWAWSLPFEMKLRRGVTKWILRQVLHRYVPARLVDRPKAGFSVPLDRWLRGPLRDWAEPLLHSSRIEDAGLRPAPVRDAWRRLVAGRAEHHRMWAVLMLIAWRQRWC